MRATLCPSPSRALFQRGGMNNTGTRVSDLFRETLPGGHSCKGFLELSQPGVTRRQPWGMVIKVKSAGGNKKAAVGHGLQS